MDKDGNLRKESSFSLPTCLMISLVVVVFFYPPPGPRAETRFTLSYPEVSGLTDIEVSGFGLGLTLQPEGEVGFGLRLGKQRAVSIGDWKLSPFISGTFLSPEGGNIDGFSGGLEASYFDYRIGSWAISSTSIAWVGSSGYKLGGTGSYSIGNLNLAYDIQIDGDREEGSGWYPVRKGSYWPSFEENGILGFGNPAGSYISLYGERRISLGEERFKWSQGVMLDYRSEPSTFGIVTRLEYRDSFLLFGVENLRIEGWSLKLSGDSVSIGFLESPGRSGRYGISVEYLGDPVVGFERLEAKYSPEMTFNLTVKW